MSFFYEMRRSLGVITYFIFVFFFYTLSDLFIAAASLLSKRLSAITSAYLGHKMSFILLIMLRVCVKMTIKLKIPLEFREKINQCKDKNLLIISNHQSYLDIPAIMYMFLSKETRFVSKKSLGYHIPLVSKIVRMQRHALIDRNSFAQSVNELQLFQKRYLNSNKALVVFPEGTRSKDGTVHPFHTTALRIILRGQTLPVAVVSVRADANLRTLVSLLHTYTSTYSATVVDFIDAVGKQNLKPNLDRAFTAIREHHQVD